MERLFLNNILASVTQGRAISIWKIRLFSVTDLMGSFCIGVFFLFFFGQEAKAAGGNCTGIKLALLYGRSRGFIIKWKQRLAFGLLSFGTSSCGICVTGPPQPLHSVAFLYKNRAFAGTGVNRGKYRGNHWVRDSKLGVTCGWLWVNCNSCVPPFNLFSKAISQGWRPSCALKVIL